MLPKWKLHKCSTTDECINLEVDTHTEWNKRGTGDSCHNVEWWWKHYYKNGSF